MINYIIKKELFKYIPSSPELGIGGVEWSQAVAADYCF